MVIYRCFKVKGRCSKVTYTAQNTPLFCEIWFVSKGKHLWTRDASEGIDGCLPLHGLDETAPREGTWSNSVQNCSSNSTASSEYFSLDSSTAAEIQEDRSSNLSEQNHGEVAISTIDFRSNYAYQTTSHGPTCMINNASLLNLASEKKSLQLCSKVRARLNFNSLAGF